MRTKVSASTKNFSVGSRSTRGYRYDPRVERRVAQSDSRSRQWPMRPTRRMAPYTIAHNKSKTTPGYPLGGKTAKTYTKTWAGLLGPYTLGVVTTDEIPKGAGINARQRDMVHLKGWKLRFHVQNTHVVPITMRVALVSPRQTIGTTPTLKNEDFLRGYQASRSQDLGDNATGLSQCINPINDDLYMVLGTTTIEIGPTPAATGYTGGVEANWASFNKWFPLNKQLRYKDAPTSVISDTPTYLVIWWDSKIRKGGDAFSVISASGQVDIRTDTIAYFHDRD